MQTASRIVELNDDGVVAVALLKKLWESRRLIIGGTGAITFSALFVVMFLPKVYTSIGFYQVRLLARIYASSRSAFLDTGRFFAFIDQGKYLNSDDLVALRSSIKGPEELTKLFAPVFENASKDFPTSKEPWADVLGIEISGSGNSPQQAQKVVFVLGAFIKDTLLREAIIEYVNSNLLAASEARLSLDNAILENEFSQQQLINKKADMQQIKREYPSAAIEIQHVFTMKSEGYQYLSPAAEVIKTEAAISDLKRERTKFIREREIANLKYNYFMQATVLIKQDYRPGTLLFSQIIELKDQFFKSKDLAKDTVKEFYNTLPTDMNTLNKTIFPDVNIDEMHFASGPTFPARKSGPHGKRIVLNAFFASFFSLIGFALISDWWKQNKSSIVN